MARVICDLAVHPHLGAAVSGVKFERDRGEAISEDVPEATAALFASIPGFRLAKAPAPPQDAPQDAPPAAPVDGDTNGDGKLSAAEKRAKAKAGA